MTHPSLITWIEKQPDWARDALRRHALSENFELRTDDKSQVLRRVRVAAGMTDEEPCENIPFSADHLKGEAVLGPRTLLASLGPVKNLARLAAGQTLRFALDGITLVYGDNGTGKSGYCRITKKICRSVTTEDLLGDVFKDGKTSPSEVAISYLIDGEKAPKTEQWKDGTPPPAAVANISVFDARNARFYVDAENRIGFLPREVALLEQYAKHCTEMDSQINDELKKLNARLKVPLPAGYSIEGPVSKLFQRLVPKTVLPTASEIRSAADWTKKDEEDLEALERRLAQDPRVLADRCRRSASLLKAYSAEADAIEVGLSTESAHKLTELYRNAKNATETAALAASERFKDEPLAGAGLPPWRLMYDYAKKYVQSLGGEQQTLATKEGDPCALCQQPLTADAAARMQRFADFINDEASKTADAANAALQAHVAALQSIAIPKKRDVENALADYRKLGEEAEGVATATIEYFDKADARRNCLARAAESGDFEKVEQKLEQIGKKLDYEAASLEVKADEHDRAAANGSAQHNADRECLAQLKDRKKLSEDLETVLARRDDLETVEKLTRCRDLLATKSVSVQITALRRDLVTADLEKRIKKEIETFDLTHLPFRVADRSAGGQSNFRVMLETPAGVANDKVLSEGEQRALALACFLGELGADTVKSGLVFDDPVSSLDHIRIRRVARRVVDEAAKGKQVVVFTHNLLFFNEVAEAAAQATPQIPVAKRIITKSTEAGFGIISEADEPWIAQKVKDRLIRMHEKLKKLKGRTDLEADEYRGAVKDFYTDLRETWERLVEEVLLGKVVERFNTDVKTQSLKGVYVDDEDYKKIYWGMKRASERSGHDMAPGRNLPVPKLDDMKTDLDELDTYHTIINKRRKEIEKHRIALEKPPPAKVL